MIAIVRIEYITICPIEASKATINAIARELEESIKKEAILKELGIDIDNFTSNQY